MTFPKRSELELPLLLEIDAAGGELPPADAYHRLIPYFPELTRADLKKMIPSGTHNKWQREVSWARLALAKREFLHREPYGVWRITPTGRRSVRRHSRQARTVRDIQETYAGRAPRQSDPEKRGRIEEAAIDAALQWEMAQGRRPRSIESENRGYDIVSRASKEVRFIEVKGLSGNGPVEMTPNEMEQSRELGEDYYLYVLAYALSPKAKLYRVRNPFANCRRVPSGWAIFWK